MGEMESVSEGGPSSQQNPLAKNCSHTEQSAEVTEKTSVWANVWCANVWWLFVPMYRPTPNVTWERIDGSQAQRIDGLRSDRVRPTVEGYGTEIEISRVEFDDAGIYRCSATNRGSAAQASQDLMLTVEG